MSRAIDYATLTIILMFTTFCWSTLLLPSWVYSLIFSIAFTLIVVITIKYFSKNYFKPYSTERLAFEFAMRNKDYLIKLIKSTLNNKEIECGYDYILTDESILISAFKFSNLTIVDICRILDQAKKHNRKSIYVMTRGIERKAYQVVYLNNMSLKLIKQKELFRFLKKHGALPTLKTPKQKITLTGFLETVFQRSNTKNYMFSGIVLILIAFLTPLKIYYLILGSISLLFALLTITPLGKGNYRADKILNILQKEESIQISLDEIDKSDL